MEKFIKLIRKQDRITTHMFHAMDEGQIEDFEILFELWHEVTSEILNNPNNQCGHKLCNEILDYAKIHCPRTYHTFYE